MTMMMIMMMMMMMMMLTLQDEALSQGCHGGRGEMRGTKRAKSFYVDPT